VYEKDDEAIDAMQEEIRYSRELMRQPPSRREDFYNSKIGPIEERLQRLAAEQTALMQHSDTPKR
jgi:hypothetical protein